MSDMNIHQADIMYEDSLVCILRPDVKKGVLIFTNYRPPTGVDSLKEIGIKTGLQLHEEGIEFGRTVIHPHIFFRAPWISRDIDYSTNETEIVSSFGLGHMDIRHRCFIRVDPDKTYVFSSEIRHANGHTPKFCIDRELNISKKTLSEYLKIIARNAVLYNTVHPMMTTKKQPAYNLYTSELILVQNNGIDYTEIIYPLSNVPIELNSEILVSISNLTPEYFVRCT